MGFLFIFSIFDSFKEVARPLLFVTYAYSSFIFFLALLRLTVVCLAMNFLYLYYFNTKIQASTKRSGDHASLS